MPINFEQTKAQIAQLRQSQAEMAIHLADNQKDLTKAKRAYEHLVSIGDPNGGLEASESKVDAETQRRQHWRTRLFESKQSVIDTIENVLNEVKPEELFTQLNGSIPIAMLPSRLETRFSRSGDRNQLRIRIYPDQIHIDAHISALLPNEISAGEEYWQLRRGGDAEKLQEAWLKMCQQYTPTRSAWIVQSLTPTNFHVLDEPLVFREVSERLDDAGTVACAKLLPDRWVAVGYRKSTSNNEPEYTKIFQKWGKTVPDTLNVTVSFDELADEIDDDEALPIDPEMLWTVDYEEAVRVGMAMTVSDDDLFDSTSNLSSGVDLLVVTGIDWTQSEEESAGKLAELLQAHHYSDGMAFVPQGVPTNSTSTSSSGFTTDPIARAKEIDPTIEFDPEQDDTGESDSGQDDRAAARMARGLGLAHSILPHLPYADLREQTTSSLMIDALWESTLGYFLDDFMDPVLTDNFIDLAREHANTYLQPFGPFSAFRVGKQPYGLLPVVASKHYRPDRADGVEDTLYQLLSNLKWYWRQGLGDVAKMGKSNDPDAEMRNILQLNPVSVAKRFRLVVDPVVKANLEDLEEYAKIQTDQGDLLGIGPFADIYGSRLNAAYFTQMHMAPTNNRLYGPWVRQDEDTPNYIQRVANDALGSTEGRERLEQRTESKYLLEALLAHAALRELDRGGSKTWYAHLLHTGVIEAMPRKAALNIGSQLGLNSANTRSPSAQTVIETPKQLASLKFTHLFGRDNIALADFVSQNINKPERPELRNLSKFVESVEALSERPPEEIDRSFRATLDCYSHRLDAWYTSLASRRLEAIRQKKATGQEEATGQEGQRPVVGVYIGGYGWVEDLKPDKVPDSLGYIHAPSIAHANAAAVLRSGHLSHRGAHNNRVSVETRDAGSALRIDLSSERVHLALKLLDGVAQGQPLAALLGYRFERMLRDKGIDLMQFVMPIRALAPFRATTPEPENVSGQSIAARDVVDGLNLLKRWVEVEERPKLLSEIRNLTPTPTSPQMTEIAATLAELDALFDAVSDLLVSESVYQYVRGNHERAGAALSALDRQTRPPDPQFVRTPRSGTRYQQRVILPLQDPDLTEEWAGVLHDTRSRTSRRLSRWVADRIGDPTRFMLAAEVQKKEGDPDLLTPVSLMEFMQAQRISPLSLVLMSAETDAERPSQLEQLLAHYFATQVPNPTEEMSLTLLEEPPLADQTDSTQTETIGLGPLLTLLKMINKAVSKARAADARDFSLPGSGIKSAIDIEHLTNRVDKLEEELDFQLERLRGAIEEQPHTLYFRVLETVVKGFSDSIPEVTQNDSDARQILREQAIAVRATLLQKKEQLTARREALGPFVPDEEAAHVAELVAQIRLVLGENFPVLPWFRLREATLPVEASMAEREVLLDNEEYAPLTWLQQMAMVRPQLEKFVSVLTASEMLGAAPTSTPMQVMQLPHVPSQRWVALHQPPDESDPVLSIVTLGNIKTRSGLVGLVVDGWSEMIPAKKEMTGVTFHYDAPAARAPQSVILAVPPDLEQETWSFDKVEELILHTHELAQLRAVGPKEIPVLSGVMLPMVYLPQDRTKQIPNIFLNDIADFWQSESNSVLGRMNSYAIK